MNKGTFGRTLTLSLAGLVLATGLLASPLAGPPAGASLEPVAFEPIALEPVDGTIAATPDGSIAAGPVGADLGIDQPLDADSLQRMTRRQIREMVYTHVKDDFNVAPDVLYPALDILEAEAADGGQVDMEIIHRVTDTLDDVSAVEMAETVLVAYAEYVAFGQPVSGMLPSDAERLFVSTSKKLALARSSDGRMVGTGGDFADDVVPNLGGVCKTCTDVTTGTGPDFTIASFPVAGTYAFHASTLSGSGDCNWYKFTVQCGHRYEFRTCTPGSASFDSVLQVVNGSCTQLGLSDDEPGCGTTSVVTIVPATGVTSIYLKISAFGSGSGGYNLAYRELICPGCTAPPTELTPNNTCQYVSDCFVNCTGACIESWYTVNLVGGQGYVFTTCPNGAGSVCPSANATPTTFDTELFLYELADCPALGSPIGTSTGTTSCPAPGATNRALLSITAPHTGQFLLRLRGPFGLGANRFGCYTLGYVQTSVPTCATCPLGPFVGTITPTSTCQTVSGIVTACQDTYYLVNITFLSNYEFSTCSVVGGCLGGTTTFDSRIELYNNACTLLQQDDDGCGGVRSLFCTSTGAGPLAPGTYKLHVRGGGTGSFVLTYRSCGIPCTPPSNLTLMPTGGVASSGIGTCLKTETFFVTADGSSPVNYAWTITPPPGASATPPNGVVAGAPSSGNPAMFNSTLHGEGVYQVQACATNGCSGTPPPCITINYTLRDQTPPVLVVPPDTTVDCDSVPPAPVLSAQDNCDPDPTENYSEVIVSGACDGIYDIRRTWEAIDRSGNTTGPITQVVHVVDDEGPQIVPNPGVYQVCMWPPNHEMHCFSAVDFEPVIMDNCSLPVGWQVVSITNSEEQLEPCGDGNQDPDSTISPDGLSFCVRSERCGNDPAENDGRVYSIVIRATDACGNASLDTAAFSILIPHDMSDHSDCIEP